MAEATVEDIFSGPWATWSQRVSGKVVTFVAALICTYYGNTWYLNHARKAVAEV